MKKILFSVGVVIWCGSSVLQGAEKPKFSGLPSDSWGVIIKQGYPNDAEGRLKMRGTLSVVSKDISAQQPTIAQLGISPEDVERLLWGLHPLCRQRTVASLGHLHVNHQVSEYRKKNPEDKRSVETLKADFARGLIYEALGYPSISKPIRLTGDPIIDTLREECLMKAFLCYADKSGELLYKSVQRYYHDKDGRKLKLLLHALNAGDSVNYQDKDKNTTLHEVIEWHPFPKPYDKTPGLVQQLLEKGADLTVKHPTYGTGLEHITNKPTRVFFFDKLPSEYAIERRQKELTQGQKLIAAGVAFSPSTDAVPQLLNKHLPIDQQLSEKQIKELSKLEAPKKTAYLRMPYDQARELEKELNKSRCCIL
jgi:hypothetical protein